jgi:hypothetical protein
VLALELEEDNELALIVLLQNCEKRKKEKKR